MELNRRSFLFLGVAAGSGAIIHSIIPKSVIFDMGRVVPATFEDVRQYAFKDYYQSVSLDLSPYIDDSIRKTLELYGANPEKMNTITINDQVCSWEPTTWRST